MVVKTALVRQVQGVTLAGITDSNHWVMTAVVIRTVARAFASVLACPVSCAVMTTKLTGKTTASVDTLRCIGDPPSRTSENATLVRSSGYVGECKSRCSLRGRLLGTTRIRKLLDQCAEPSPSSFQTFLERVIDESVCSLRRLGQPNIDLLRGLLESSAARRVRHASDERSRFLQRAPRLTHSFEHLATERWMLRVLVGSPGPVTSRTLTFERLW